MNYLVRQKLEISVIAILHLIAFVVYFLNSTSLWAATLALVIGYFFFQGSVLLLATIRVDDTEDCYGSYLDYIVPSVIFGIYLFILGLLV